MLITVPLKYVPSYETFATQNTIHFSSHVALIYIASLSNLSIEPPGRIAEERSVLGEVPTLGLSLTEREPMSRARASSGRCPAG